jgi:hypothetical protein
MACTWTYTDLNNNKVSFTSEEKINKYITENSDAIKQALAGQDVLYQGPKGAFNTLTNTIYALSNPDITTFPHELAHAWEQQLTNEERQIILDWAGQTTWTRETSEMFAKGFEVFLAEGNTTKSPKMNVLFENFAKWLAEIYVQLKQALGIELNDKMREVYSAMLNSQYVSQETKDIILEAEQAGEATQPTETPQAVTIDLTTEDGEVYTANINRNGEQVGQIKAVSDGSNLVVNEANVTTPRQGIGIQAYRQLGEQADTAGLNLQSDTFNRLSPEATGLWEKLVTTGEAVKGENNYTFVVKKEAEQKPITEEVIVEQPITEEVAPGITYKDVTTEVLIDTDGSVTGIQNAKYTAVKYNGQTIGEYYEQDGEFINVDARVGEPTFTKEAQALVDAINRYNQKQAAAPKTAATEEVKKEVALTRNDIRISTKPNSNGWQAITNLVNGELLGHIKQEDNGDWVNPELSEEDAAYYLGDTKKEAEQAFLDDYNEKTGRVEEIKPAEEYKSFVQDGETITARVTKYDGKIAYLETNDGTTYKKAESLLTDATKQDYDNQKPLAKPTPKYKVGDAVTTTQNEDFIIQSVEVRQDPKTGRYEVVYYNQALNVIPEAGITSKARVVPETKSYQIKQEHKDFNTRLTNIARRFQNLFGDQIKFQTGYYDFNAPARFYKGIVQVNLNYANLQESIDYNEVVAHEFMHPFVEAIKMSNKPLYNNLIKDLQENHKDLIAEVAANDNYEQASKTDEALAIFLGKELSKAFDKQGNPDINYLLKKPLLREFVEWLSDIVDFLLGNKRTKSLDQFVKDINANTAKSKRYLKSELDKLEKNEDLKNQFEKDLKTKISFNEKLKILVSKKHENKYRNIIGEEAYDKISNEINALNEGNPLVAPKFEFIITPQKNNSVTYDISNPKNVKIFIDPELGNAGNNVPDLLKRFLRNIEDNDIYNELVDEINANFYINSKNDPNKEARAFNVSELNPAMKLNDLSDFVLYQMDKTGVGKKRAEELWDKKETTELTENEKRELESIVALNNKGITINYTREELTAIDDLEAYYSLDASKATKLKNRVEKKLEWLRDVANRRVKEPSLLITYNGINKILKSSKSDVEFAMEYFEQANTSINYAYRKYSEIVKTIAEKTGTISKPELIRLNRELASVREIMAFYEDFEKFTDVTFNPKIPGELENEMKFKNSIVYITKVKQGMQDAAINLTTEWLTPYMTEHNKYIKEQGYTDEKYYLTPELIYKHFKYGEGEDVSAVSYWLGSNITSNNPINALVSNVIGDQLSFNNIDTYADVNDLSVELTSYFAAKGITSEDAKLQYYKDNFLHKVQYPHREYDEITDDYKDTYVEKWALIQEYRYDLFDRDAAKYEESLKTIKDDEERAQKLAEWKMKYGSFKQTKNAAGVVTKTEFTLTSPKYLNAKYASIKNDSLFKALEKYYNESNVRYGEQSLKYGIVPQMYNEDFWGKVKKAVEGITTPKKIEEKYNEVVDSLAETFGAENEDQGARNLDGTIYRSIPTKLTSFKDDANINLNLFESMVDYVTESRRYSTLKDSQHMVGTLMLLLEGNTSFDVNAREFKQSDISRKLEDDKKYQKAKKKLVELDADIAAGKAVDTDYYDKVKKIVEDGPQQYPIIDKFAKTIAPSITNRANETLVNEINEKFFGIGAKDFTFKGMSAKKIAHYVSLYTSFNSMAFNRVGAIGNITTGNTQMLIEAHGGKYYTKKELAAALSDYTKNIPNYLRDTTRPIKSKDNQLAIMLDAMQGEINDEFGNKITGNISSKVFRVGSFFILTQLGEHQLQITNMKAMLSNKKVTTKTGEIISLYDAFIADPQGRYSLRKDINFTEEEFAKFRRDLHGVNRMLNGNYSSETKTELERKWYGQLVLKFRKYMYPAYRARWSGERVDYERNTPEVGYFNYFFTKYMPQYISNLRNGKFGLGEENMQPHEIYALRKAKMEIGVYMALTLLALAMTGGDDDKKELSNAEKSLLYFINRLHADLEVYNGGLPKLALAPAFAAKGRLKQAVPTPWEEPIRQIKNPTASLRTVESFFKVIEQSVDPSEVYTKKGNGYEKGDNKLRVKLQKLVPFVKQYNEWMVEDFADDINDRLSYFNMVNKNVIGVSAKESR